MFKKKRKLVFSILIILLLTVALGINSFAQSGITISNEGITINSSDNPEDVTNSIRLLLYLTVLSVLPSIIIMMTSFTRIIVILSFLRNAMGTQQMPPNQVLIGLALFLPLLCHQY